MAVRESSFTRKKRASLKRAEVIFGLVLFLVILLIGKPAQATTIFYEGFETGLDSNWQRGDTNPESGRDYFGTVDWTAKSGSKSAWCAAVGRQGEDGELNTSVRKYDNRMWAYLKREVDLTGLTSATISFWYKVPSADPSPSPVDVGRFGIAQGTRLNYFTPYLEKTGGWVQFSMDITPYVGVPATFIWEWNTDGEGIGEGLYLDEIVITATSGNGGSSPSEDLPPATPQGLTVTYTDGQIILSWNANSDEDLAGYNIYRSTEESLVGEKLNVSPFTETSYIDSNLKSGTTYYYRISAVDKAGNESQLTNAVVITTPSFPSFKDVSNSFWAYNYITYLAQKGIISGYPDKTFKPEANITRAEFAKIIVVALGASLPTTYRGVFLDVSSSHWAWKYIEKAEELGILSGYPDGSFRPDRKITRAEIAKMIINAGGFITNTSGLSFPDVPSTHWAYSFIMTARNEDIVGGYADGTFKPDDFAKRAEAAKMVYAWLTK